LSDVLTGDVIPAGKLAYFQARLSNRLHEAVLNRFMQLEKEKGLTRAELARRIGRKPEQVTRWLGSSGNWTLETVSDLLTAMGCELSVELMELARHHEPQAVTLASLQSVQPAELNRSYAIINATNSPVTAEFRAGQLVFVTAIPSGQYANTNLGGTLGNYFEGCRFHDQPSLEMQPPQAVEDSWTDFLMRAGTNLLSNQTDGE